MLRNKEKVFGSFLAVIDVLIAWVAIGVIVLLADFFYIKINSKDLTIALLLSAIIWYALSGFFSLNQMYRSRPYSVVLFNCFGMITVGTFILAALLSFLRINLLNLYNIGLFYGLVIFITFGAKVIFYTIMKYLRLQGHNYRTIVIIGDNSAIPFIEKVNTRKEWGYRIVAVIGVPAYEENSHKDFPTLPASTEIHSLLTDKAVDELIYIKRYADPIETEELIQSCAEIGVVFRMYSPLFNMLTSKMHLHYFHTTPLLTISNTPLEYLPLRIKAIFDFLFSLSVVILLSPVFALIALIIKMTSKGPVFFKQKRVGLRGRKFFVYKFRTMVVNAEALQEKLMAQNEMDGPTFKMTNDPRITGIGKFLRKTSLDELPQFFNVLLGDMSIVGPRPPVPKEVQKYERWQLRRLSMKPGITCIWQVSGRNEISFEEWMRMDMEYIDNWSLKLDFIIFLKTIRTMIVADGK